LAYHLTKNYQSWWQFDEVMAKTILHNFFETRCSWWLCVSGGAGRSWKLALHSMDLTCVERSVLCATLKLNTSPGPLSTWTASGSFSIQNAVDLEDLYFTR